MNSRSRWFLSCFTFVLSFTLIGPVHAQDEEDEALAEMRRLIEEVIVTAQKKEQNLQKVPTSVASIHDEKLDVLTSGGMDIRLLSSRVPSLHIESSFGRTLPRFYIRGLGNTDFDLNASQPVSLIYDGVVLENPILKGFPIFDLDRVEVLRGPQGTLFGRNTPAGIIKFESKKPTHQAEGFGRISYGIYNTVQFEGAVGGPVAEDILAVRASALYQGRSDWVDNKFTGEDDALGSYTDIAARLQFLYTPTYEFSALINVHGRDLDGTARLFRANLVKSGSDEVRDEFERDEIWVDGGNEQSVEEFGGVATLEYDLGEVTVTSVTGFETAEFFSRGDVDGGFGAAFAPPSGPYIDIPFPSESADGIPDLTQFTEEFRVASNDWETVNFQAGVFYFKEDLDVESFSYSTLGGGVEDGFATQNQETRAVAGFGTLDIEVSEQFTASGGLRYSHDEKDFTAERVTSPFGAGPFGPKSVNPDAGFLSWDLKGLFEVNNDVNVYGRVARSFRAPSIQGRVLFGGDVTVADEEKILSFEAGVKANLMGNRARANISVFQFTMDDQQLTAVGGAGNFNTLLNADQTNGVGFEAELELLPMNEVFITAGASFNKTEIDDPTLGIAPGGAAGITVLDPVISDTSASVSIDGNSLPNAPEWVFNATARVAIPVGCRGEAFLYTDWAYRSEISFFLYESVEFMDEGLVEGGVRVGYATFDRGYEVALFARNITDDVSRTGGIDFNNLTGFVNEPRTFGLEIRRAF